MSIYSGFLTFRKRLFDGWSEALYRRFPVDADEITRLSGWFSFGAGWLVLGGVYWAALGALVLSLLLDAVDGAYARRQGKVEPQIDWAMDRFTEAVLSAALLFVTDGAWPAWVFVAIFIANNFLPLGGIPVLAHRWGVCAYLLLLAVGV